MHGTRRALVVIGLWLFLPGAAGAEPPVGKPPADGSAPQAEPAPLAVRDGYVWRDAKGVVRLGEAVIAMGVMGDPGWTVSEPLAGRLAPWSTAAKGAWTFWNYALESGTPADFASLPKAFVRLRGREKAPPGGDPFNQVAGALEEARLVQVEPIDAEWVRAWRPFFTDIASPWRVAKVLEKSSEGRRRFVGVAAAALVAMRARPGPDEGARAAVKGVDPDARVVETFRRRTEHGIQRWLVTETKALGIPWPQDLTVVPLPPTTTEVQRLFLEAETKAAFLAAASKAWSGDPELVELVYYQASARDGMESITWTETDLARLKAEWDEATYARHRATTKATVGR